MSRLVKGLGFACLLVFLAGGALAQGRARTYRGAAHSFHSSRAFADLERQVDLGPRSRSTPGGAAEVRLIKRRLRDAGLNHRIRMQQPWNNVIARLRGREPGTIVIGAHHDTKDGIPGFVGANDGASGVAVLLEMARVLPRPLPGPSVNLVFFDAEEPHGSRSFEVDGTRGSRQFVRYAKRRTQRGRHGSPRLRNIRAMILLDMVGDCDLHIPREANSRRWLYRLFHGSPFGGRRGPILDDHIPFLNAGIPAVDIIDASYGPANGSLGAWWHTPNDTVDHVCARSLNSVGRATIRALGSL